MCCCCAAKLQCLAGGSLPLHSFTHAPRCSRPHAAHAGGVTSTCSTNRGANGCNPSSKYACCLTVVEYRANKACCANRCLPIGSPSCVSSCPW